MTDRQQKNFEKHCNQWLAMNLHLQIARNEYRLAHHKEPIEYKKQNAGVKAMNLYLLNELKKVGADNWKDDSQQTQKKINLNAVKNADGVQRKKHKTSTLNN